ncbi:MAG TPA: aldo/keto reductase [Candidatus Choladousia intestinigallinarum]|nr:aldo/keto reductase [Candidatus Choladousia intestinigallinarum]
MNYRKLGNTGLSVSEIGLGCEGFVEGKEEKTWELVDAAESLGVNYIDLYTSDPEARSNLGKALRGRREKFILQAHLCTIWEKGQYKRTRKIEEVKKGFEDLLEHLETDYIEVGMIHYVDSLKDWEEVKNGEVMRYAQELKKEGRIGAIGLSSHNPQAARAAAESGLIQVLMFSVNPCYDLQPAGEDVEALWAESAYASRLVNMDPERERLYEVCQNLGVGITVMKAFGGGDLLDEKLSPAGKALTVCQCLHYALTRPGVATVLSGARTAQQLCLSAAYEEASEEEKDYAGAFADFPKISWEGHCMYCGHCAPCPKGIDVAMATKLLNLTKAQGHVPETVREHYEALSHKASECIACGACVRRCPFKVDVMKNMEEAAEVFGS